MKLSLKGDYALRALLVLASQPPSEIVHIQFISNAQNIPKRFLEQILNDLRNAGFVQSRRGIQGGYRLAKPADQITLAEVIRYMEGALAPVNCVSERFYEKCSCPDESRCAIRSVMKEVRDAIAGILGRLTLADLASRAESLRTSSSPPDYSI